jgi:hypothetical protein
LVNMVDVHFAATQNKAIEEHVFKYWKPRKKKNTID